MGSDFLEDHLDKYEVIVEGSLLVGSDRSRQEANSTFLPQDRADVVRYLFLYNNLARPFLNLHLCGSLYFIVLFCNHNIVFYYLLWSFFAILVFCFSSVCGFQT